MMECGRMTKLTVTVSTLTWMEQDMKEIGSRTSSMVKVSKLGLMVPAIKALMLKERNKELVVSSGLIKVLIPDSLKRTIFKAKVFIIGLMGVSTKVYGSITKWKVMEHSPGPMADATKDSTLMTRRKERVSSTGQTDANTTENGSTESSMVLAHTQNQMESLAWASGRMEIESNGSDQHQHQHH